MLDTTVASFFMVVALALGQGKSPFPGKLDDYVRGRVDEFDDISRTRQEELGAIARYVADRRQAGEPARLTFICTHNSRRSHMCQVWAQTAAAYYGLTDIETYSGGTEATAFNPRAVDALRRAGFDIPAPETAKNPRYQVQFSADAGAMECFSKVYSEAPNPRKDFCAVMTCSQADEACPIVEGATARVAIPYDDPKAFDGMPDEAGKYDERCGQIAREMLYLFSRVER